MAWTPTNFSMAWMPTSAPQSPAPKQQRCCTRAQVRAKPGYSLIESHIASPKALQIRNAYSRSHLRAKPQAKCAAGLKLLVFHVIHKRLRSQLFTRSHYRFCTTDLPIRNNKIRHIITLDINKTPKNHKNTKRITPNTYHTQDCRLLQAQQIRDQFGG